MRKAAGNRGNQANDPIVCKYVRRMAREKVLIARNNTSQISVSDLKFPPTIKVDHISNFSHLTPRLLELFYETRKYRTTNGMVKGMSIYLRKSDDSKVVKLNSIQDIVDLQKRTVGV